MAAGGNEQPTKDHLARRRNRETAGLPDVHSFEGAGPFLKLDGAPISAPQREMKSASVHPGSTNVVYFSCFTAFGITADPASTR